MLKIYIFKSFKQKDNHANLIEYKLQLVVKLLQTYFKFHRLENLEYVLITMAWNFMNAMNSFSIKGEKTFLKFHENEIHPPTN